MLQIELLGALQITENNQPISLSRSKKIEGLLVYVAMQSRPSLRHTLMGLLFPESPEDQARTTLRQTLRRLRKTINDENAPIPYLLLEKETIQLNPASDITIDVHQFESMASGCAFHSPNGDSQCADCLSAWESAASLYRGSFLTDFYLEDCAEFEAWAEAQRAVLRQTMHDTLIRLTDAYTKGNQYERAIQSARRLIALDEWDETAHRHLLHLLARSGQRPAALQHYNTLCQILDTELGIEPDEQTKALVDRIKTATDSRPHNLPHDLPSFVGRDADKAAIHTALADPQKRLITLLGGGGIGKTRLALEIARDVQNQRLGAFMHGVFFVELSDVDSAEIIPTTIATALNLDIIGKKPPEKQLIDFLRDRETLIILDNVEQLATTALPFLNRLLKTTQHTKIIATSRIHLNLTHAWSYELSGLPTPTLDLPTAPTDGTKALPLHIDPTQHPALALFLDRAAQNMTGFSLDILPRTEQAAILHICQQTEGHPLALELAASWVRVMSCTEIAQEIDTNIDILETDSPDKPDRHRSIRAVFVWSWNLLPEAAQNLLIKLSLFRGDFGYTAAQEITDADRRTLATLIDHSLLQRKDQRFHLHPLLRQFAADLLSETATETLSHRHADYFVEFAQGYIVHLSTDQQTHALTLIETELPHIRTAWLWLTQQAATKDGISKVGELAHILQAYFNTRSQYRAGLALFEAGLDNLGRAVQDISQPPAGTDYLLGTLSGRVGEYHYHLGNFDKANTALQTALRYSLPIPHHPAITNAYLYLGTISRLQGRPLDSEAFLQEALTHAKQAQNEHSEGFILMGLGAASLALGAYDQAETYISGALATFEPLQYQFGIAHSLRWQGVLARHQEKYEQAHTCFTQSLTMCTAMGDKQGEAMVCNDLSILSLLHDQPQEAQQYSQQSLQLDAHNETPIIKADTLRNLGLAYDAQDNVMGAQTHLREALQLAAESDILPLALSIALDVVDKVMLPAKNPDAFLMADTIANHSATEWHTKVKADSVQLVLAQTMQAPQLRDELDKDKVSFAGLTNEFLSNQITNKR